MMRKARHDDESRIWLRSRVGRPRIALLWMVAWQFVFVAAIVWFAATWNNPNYRLIFVPDDLMRVRNAIYILIALASVGISVSLYRIATGAVPLACFHFNEEGYLVVDIPRGPLASVWDRTYVLRMPVELHWEEQPKAKVVGDTMPRILKIRSSGVVVRIGTLWPWDKNDVERLDALLRGPRM